MASLTPGILQKLLQNAGNKHFKVAGEHRSALLQVISIVPCLEDDPWKSRGYYLRVSDSLHAAYVSVSDEDVELILSDKVQLGQFIHVAWLDSGSPVPVLHGIKPIPKRRPCVGDPQDLISSDCLNPKKVEIKVKSKEKVKKVVGINGHGSVVVGGGLEGRRLSLDSARKGWDSSPISKNGAKRLSMSKSRDKDSQSDSVVMKKAVSEDSPKSSRISPLTSKNVMISPKLLTKPIKSLKLCDDDVFPINLNKVALGSKKGPEQKILWDSLSSTICHLGQGVRSYRHVKFVSAVHALEEASVYESVIQCMSMFAELLELKDCSSPLIERFLSVHESIKKASTVVCTLINMRSPDPNDSSDSLSQRSEPRTRPSPASKNASLWVQAAVETNLSKFSLYTKGDEKGTPKSETCHYIVIDESPEKTKHSPLKKPFPQVKEPMSQSRKHLSTRKGTNVGQESWLPGSGLKHTASLVEKLLSSSRAWFLDYMEDSLDNGFGLGPSRDNMCQIAVLLGQLKRVNQWLDGAFEDGGQADERIERLKKKLYLFLLDHVDSAVSCR
ncbi:uncharacterized protein LOC105173388 [Sesamum indicum]|uniref:Uncharacterized protein LOC105173388 n=1 Tax=Sesamum indicum TaxID=4182 RepID=A0A6I9U0D7_SESIN|nr:uncharacterized protein LOC105173388 [Sesamum indicum]